MPRSFLMPDTGCHVRCFTGHCETANSIEFEKRTNRFAETQNHANAKLFIDACAESKASAHYLWVRVSKPFAHKTSLISFSPFSPDQEEESQYFVYTGLSLV